MILQLFDKILENIMEIMMTYLPEEFQVVLAEQDGIFILTLLGLFIIVVLFLLALYCLTIYLLIRLKNRIFRAITKKKGKNLSIQFLERAITLAMTICFIILPLGGDKFARTFLGSATVIAAVVGLAANEVIKNMFGGLQITVYKPFDIGSRIQLEDGRAGIIESIDLRQTVIVLMDSTRIIVPNSKMNEMIVTNYSYLENVPRALVVKYPISYSSDVEKAKEVLRKTICECPLTLNEDKTDESDPNSRMVYFLEVADSALILGATLTYPHNIRTEVLKDEINCRVFAAFAENGIEIPYQYMNVVMKEG